MNKETRVNVVLFLLVAMLAECAIIFVVRFLQSAIGIAIPEQFVRLLALGFFGTALAGIGFLASIFG